MVVVKKEKSKDPLGFDVLYGLLDPLFDEVVDDRGSGCAYTLSSQLRTGFSLYSLKTPSLNHLESRSQSELSNLKSVYGIDEFSSANCFRDCLDEVDPTYLKEGFVALSKELEKRKILQQYLFRGRYLVSIDGVEYFCSHSVHCPKCLKRVRSNGEVEYYHQMLVAVLVHPDQREVYPIGCEAIIQQDGQEKNDCERNAAKRLLKQLKGAYPAWKMSVLEDALYSNGPHLKQVVDEAKMTYLIGVKPKDHKVLFRQFDSRVAANKHKSYQFEEEKDGKKTGIVHEFQWANNLPLNSTHADIRVNLLRYTETKPNGRKQYFSWIVHWKLTKANVYKSMRAGRSRWKIENETFNTLKNQGYYFEHNFGHGRKNLATVLAILMLLAFCVDQIQQHSSKYFGLIWQGLKTKKKLWEILRAVFALKRVKSMTQLWETIAQEYKIKLDTS